MCILPLDAAATSMATEQAPPPPCAAKQLTPQQRQQIALDVLADQSITDLARRHGVSRKFIRRQRRLATDALDAAFAPEAHADQRVLFYLPVSRAWLEQLSLALVLICHSSLRGVHEVLRDLFGYPKSIAAIHGLLRRAIAKATQLNAKADLSRVGEAALDELFSNSDPVLSVVDVASTYCCLLSLEEHRCATTWGVRLLELQEQGFRPHATIGDGGSGWRAGVAEALPGVDCKADVFHVVRDVAEMVRFLEKRAYLALSTSDKLQRQAARYPADAALLAKAEAARREVPRAVALADDVAVLARWLHLDVLGVAGPRLAVRQGLFDFVLQELAAREPECEHRIKPVCSVLRRHKAELLAFVEGIDLDIGGLAAWAGLPEAVVREMVAVQEMPQASAARWPRDGALHERLGQRYHALSQMVEALRQGVVRASSVVENVNSRLRNYFFLRKAVGQGYLELLRFFLNHRRFLRSEHEEREGKSPAELLSGQRHEHWLEMLGYQPFRRPA